MSASWWGKCPICNGKIIKIENEMKEKYGKISEAEYKKLVKKRDEIKENEDEEENVPVYDESYFDEKTKCLNYDVGATCQDCGAEWNAEIKIKPTKPKGEEE